MRISKDTIQSASQVNIYDALSPVLPLKKMGNLYKCRCPFHNEKSASFTVNPERNIYKCFGCGKGGDAITFFMEHEGFTFPESVKYVCEQNKIPFVTDTDGDEQDAVQQRTSKILEINRVTLDFFKSLMKGSKSYTQATGRGYSDETITKWELGHSSALFTKLYKHLQGLNYSDSDIFLSGVVKQKEDGGAYDAFRDRWIFPIHNVFGKIIGFSGRRLLETTNPKYINSSETAVFKKSNELFGLFFAKKSIIEHDNAILVEGATDVISMHQAGICNTVATLGTAFSASHAKIIKRYTDNVTSLFDGDQAGLKATFKSCEELLKEGLMVYICPLPEGKDPDQCIREMGDAEFKDYISANRKEFIEYRTSLLSESVNEKAKVAKELYRMINLHPDRIVRNVLLSDYNKKFGFKLESYTATKTQEESESLPMEFHILRVMLLYGQEYDVHSYFKHTEQRNYVYYFKNMDYLKLFTFMMDNQNLSITEILHNEDQEIADTASGILNTKFDVSDNPVYDIMSCFFEADRQVIEKLEQELWEKGLNKNFKSTMSLIALHKEDIQNNIMNNINKATS
jgi:DNA primase